MKNLNIVYGVNGIGKTTYTKELVERTKGSKHLTGSIILMQQIFSLSKAQIGAMEKERQRSQYLMLESIKPEVKKEAYVLGVIDFAKSHQKQTLFLDTHLMQPIRTQGELRYENMWDDRLLEVVKSIIILVGTPQKILERKTKDLRIRDVLTVDEIAQDQKINLEQFNNYKHNLWDNAGIQSRAYDNSIDKF
jgi:adenylate kinase